MQFFSSSIPIASISITSIPHNRRLRPQSSRKQSYRTVSLL
ncbi:hypothetical protein HMPREF1548_05370 [Clostridium sp. KLE 1755]|nr:hypothetical protein HMPREF1548_05370 [Clostridium sp. KLE 1755]